MNQGNPDGDHDLLIRLETKVDAFIAAQTDHEVRLRLLERQQEQTNGTSRGISNMWRWIIAALGLVVGVIDPAVMLYLGARR